MFKFLFLLVLLFHRNDGQSSWSITIPLLDGTQRVIYFPISQSSTNKDEQTKSTCQSCFHFQTLDNGRRMLIESCGISDCVPMVNSTDLRDNRPSISYDFNQCGIIDNRRSILNKALQLKVSTSIKNTLRPAEYPWLVRIESRTNIFSRTVTLCGGTLIHPQWIITAAHCMFDSKVDRLYPTNGISLYMGNYHRLRTSRDEYVAKPVLYVINPKFRISRSSPAPIHDLALIKLANPVPLSRSIGVACLPEKNDKLSEGTLAFTAGWGHASPGSSAVNEPRKARIKIAPRSCRSLMTDRSLHICGRNDRGHNICSGDSGTGLMVRAGTKSNNTTTSWKWYIFGVASFGLDECSQSVNHDNAFASVANDIDWIHEVINKY